MFTDASKGVTKCKGTYNVPVSVKERGNTENRSNGNTQRTDTNKSPSGTPADTRNARRKRSMQDKRTSSYQLKTQHTGNGCPCSCDDCSCSYCCCADCSEYGQCNCDGVCRCPGEHCAPPCGGCCADCPCPLQKAPNRKRRWSDSMVRHGNGRRKDHQEHHTKTSNATTESDKAHADKFLESLGLPRILWAATEPHCASAASSCPIPHELGNGLRSTEAERSTSPFRWNFSRRDRKSLRSLQSNALTGTGSNYIPTQGK